jgi:hypothetical protein
LIIYLYPHCVPLISYLYSHCVPLIGYLYQHLPLSTLCTVD